MKHRFTLIFTALMLMITSFAWGQARTTVTDQLTRESTGITSTTYASWSGVTSNSDAVYAGQSAGGNNSIQLRSNNNNSGIITTESGGTVMNVTVTWNSNTSNGRTLNIYGKDTAYGDPADLYNASTQGTLIGSIVYGTSTSLDISDSYQYIGMRSASGAMYLTDISITWSTGGGQQTVATPTFSPAAGTYYEAQNVTISCSTAGATIYYTTNGNNPTTSSAVYSSPIAISETTTVKAMAVKAGMNNSNVATATYEIQAAPSVVTIAEARAAEVGSTVYTSGIVTSRVGTTAYIQDNTAAICVYGNNTLTVGHQITVSGTLALYNGLLEITNPTIISDVESTSVTPEVMTVAQIVESTNQGWYIRVESATVTAKSGQNTTIEQNGSSIVVRGISGVTVNVNDIISLNGNIGHYNSANQIANPTDVTIHQDQDQVATPTFTPAAGTYTETQNVTIACTTEGASIYYTLDGTNPNVNSTAYSTPIAISETTTVKAFAVKAGMDDSEIATATYTIQTGPSVITIAAARALANNEYALVQGVVTFIDGRNVYVQDATAGIDLYLNSNTVPSGLALGDMVQAYGKKTVFNGLVELTAINGGNADQFSIISSGNTLPLAVKTIAEILADHNGDKMLQSTRVQIVEATVGTINNNNNTPISQGDNTLNIYKMPVVEGLLEGDIATVIGIVGCYNNPQLRVANAADVTFTHPVVETVATPTFTPAAGTYTEAQSVTIACATEGASIYYTLDGTDPTVNSTAYTTAITISENTTVKAFAVKQGMNDSEIATAVYEFQQPTPPAQETSYTLITNNNALIAGDKYIVVGIKGENYKALGKQAANNRTGVDVTPVENVITLTPATTNEGGVFELTLGQVDGKWTLYDAVNEGYLYAASSSSNYLKVQAENDANGQWTIEIESTGVATIKAQGTNTRNWLRLNTSGTPFACYASGQLDVYLYKAGDVPTPPTPTYYNVAVASGITNGTVTVNPTSALEGATITVTAEAASGYELSTLTYTYGTTTNNINLETMQFVMPAADVTVNATFNELDAVATPTFTPAAGSYISAQIVALACATEGATIYYTTDGTTPTTESTVYAEPLTVSETTTVKAFAVKEGMNNSAVTTATYIIIEPITIAEARALENNEYALVQGVVTFIDGRNVYVQDATAGIDLYLNSNTVPSTLALGDMVKGYGKKTVYNGLTELTAINGGDENQFLVLSSGNPLPVAVMTIAEILADHNGAKMLQSTRVQIVDATVGTINNNNNTPISQGENTLNIYKLPLIEGLEQGDLMTVTGIVGCYNNPQLRVANATDVTFTHPAGITVNPTALSGFNYVYEEGPSTIKTFVISGRSITAPTHIYAPESYEMSSFPGDSFNPESHITINTYTGIYSYTIKVRLKAGLEVGDYNESIMICEDEVDTLYIALSGSVTNDQPQPQGDYTRLADLSQLTSGSKVIFAARYNEIANEYFAMTAQASGKPEGVLFTSVESNGETLPAEITDAEATFYWTVDVNGDNYTFTNANGDVLGYNSSTNFATGGDNTAWAITFQTSEATAMVPNYSAFVINNVNNAVRAFALNGNHNFGPYHTQNMTADNYNFFIDMFATVGGGTLTCATPTFTPDAGTYYETQIVTINCSTADATIYYTTDGSDPDENSTVYSEPITVAESMTIKAIAMKEGYENSQIATAVYTITVGAVTIFEQDWEGDMNGWTFVTVEGSKPWTVNQYQGNHYAYANGYNGGMNEQWCISPAFNLNEISNATLSFRNAKNYTGPDMQLYFSNNYDGENPSSATWTELEFNKSTGSYAWAESGSIDLSNFTGDNCYIGFKYTSTETEAAAWEVDDITLMGFTTEPYLTVTPSALSGFTHIIGQGPSATQTFVLTAGNITPAPGGTTGSINVSVYSPFEISLDDEEYGDEIFFEDVTNLEATTIYVRMNGTEVGQYNETVNIYASSGNEASVSLSGTVTEEPIPGGDWNRIYALTDLHDGDQVIIAARYDATVGDGYYAMTAGVSGKPDGVLFTSVNNGGVEQLPAEISGDADTYMWNVTLDGDVITLTNAAGDMLGYSSSTNFAGNTNTEWNIALMTSEEGALIPNYTGFVITNAETTNRGIAKNNNNKFGAYATSNMSNPDYNFYLDLFVYGGSVTPTVATPVFSIASGTYYEAIDVEITCATDGATIYYTTDGSDPTAESEVYEEPILVDSDMTIKAIAMMEGYDNSGIAAASYVIITDIEVLLYQDWEGDMNGWTFVTIEGNKPWVIGSYAGNHYANANGYGDDVDNEQWCISPAIDLSSRDYQNVTLTFMNATKFNGPALELYISNDYDGQDPINATWLPLEYIPSEGNYTWTESGEILLDEYISGVFNIGFRYISTIDEGAAAWEVDDIMIVGDYYDNVITPETTLDVDVWNNSNELMIVNNSSNELQVVVFNLVGQPVLSETIATGSNVIRHNLIEGVYIVRIADGNEMRGVKVLVRR